MAWLHKILQLLRSLAATSSMISMQFCAIIINYHIIPASLWQYEAGIGSKWMLQSLVRSQFLVSCLKVLLSNTHRRQSNQSDIYETSSGIARGHCLSLKLQEQAHSTQLTVTISAEEDWTLSDIVKYAYMHVCMCIYIYTLSYTCSGWYWMCAARMPVQDGTRWYKMAQESQECWSEIESSSPPSLPCCVARRWGRNTSVSPRAKSSPGQGEHSRARYVMLDFGKKSTWMTLDALSRFCQTRAKAYNAF